MDRQEVNIHFLPPFMDMPGNDASSIAGMLAGGAQVCVFSSGRGTPLGSPIAPVIKITGNAGTWAAMEDNIDFDASPVITAENCRKSWRQTCTGCCCQSAAES